MSTKSTITYVGGLHIFREQNSGDICMEFDSMEIIYSGRKKNDPYDVPTLTFDELKKIRDDLGKFIERYK